MSDDDTDVGGTDLVVGGFGGRGVAFVAPTADVADGADAASLAARRSCIASRMPGFSFI